MRKPFKGFSNGGAATDFGLETLHSGGVVLIKGDSGWVNWVRKGREEMGRSFRKMDWILSSAWGSPCGKL